MALFQNRMLSRLGVSGLLLLTALWSNLLLAQPPILGTWSGEDSDGDTATFVFNADHSAEVKLEGVPRLSTHTMTNGKVEWTGNVDQAPMLVDIVIYTAGVENGRIPLVIEQTDDQSLKIQMPRDMSSRFEAMMETTEVFQVLATKQ